MTQADRVLSTPPTNTSVTNPSGPVDPTRRRFLTVAAGGAVAAAIPIAALTAAPAPDPIYAAIERHKAAAVIWDAAVTARAYFPDTDMNDEQAEQCDLLDEAREIAWEPCEQSAIDLINTAPTTLAGIVAAIQHVRIQMQDDGTFMPHGLDYENGGDAQETMGWIDAFLDTLAYAVTELELSGKAVQS
jgi:hypothetical protein